VTGVGQGSDCVVWETDNGKGNYCDGWGVVFWVLKDGKERRGRVRAKAKA